MRSTTTHHASREVKDWRKTATRIGFLFGLTVWFIGLVAASFTGNFSPFITREVVYQAITFSLLAGIPYALMVSTRRNPRTWKAVVSITIIVIIVLIAINSVRMASS